ncbi:MAG: hypothetical protein ABEJ31_13755 [Haloarculaceae archaeon]
MSGSLGATVRTALVGAGFVLLFGGILTLAYPPLLALVGMHSQAVTGTVGRRGTAAAMGPSLFVSFLAIVWGLTVVAGGLAIPGRTGGRTVPQPPFTARQRRWTLLGATLVVLVPLGFGIAYSADPGLLLGFVPVVLLALVGSILVTVGFAKGLQH